MEDYIPRRGGRYCPSIEKTTVANFFKEAQRLRQVAHPNIVGLRGICVLPPTICLVLELCAGTLFKLRAQMYIKT